MLCRREGQPMYDAVVLEVNGLVAHLVLNRPAKHNALPGAGLYLVELVDLAIASDDTRD